jgi:ribosomal-protein-alanine N-acetyltransferase
VSRAGSFESAAVMSARPHDVDSSVLLRPMLPADMDGVLRIEKSAYEFPWSRAIFSDCLIAGYFARVLDTGDDIAGYAILSTAADEAHILNLCVDSAHRRGGLGRQLLTCLLDYANDTHLERLFLEVRPSNTGAIALYVQAGFKRLGLRKSYYRRAGGREDALVLMLEMHFKQD